MEHNHAADTELKRSVKQSIIIRKDAGLDKWGYVNAGIRASMAAVLTLKEADSDRFLDIPVISSGVADVLEGRFGLSIIEVEGEQELTDVFASWGDIPKSIIKDSGLTEFNGIPTITACAGLFGEAKAGDKTFGETGFPVFRVFFRKELNMRKGKLVAQGAHAVMAAILDLSGRQGDFPKHRIPMTDITEAWLTGNFRKIALGASSREDIDKASQSAEEACIPVGTFMNEAGIVAIAVGPGTNSGIDPITSSFKLI